MMGQITGGNIMVERIFDNIKTSATGIAAAVITIAALFGFDLSGFEIAIIAIIGAIGSIGLLFAKD